MEEVNSFVYLGSTINSKEDSTEEIKRRIGMAKCTTMKMENIWKSKVVSTRVKLRLIDTIVLPVMSHGSESWALKKTDERKICVFEVWAYRTILRIHDVKRKQTRGC